MAARHALRLSECASRSRRSIPADHHTVFVESVVVGRDIGREHSWDKNPISWSSHRNDDSLHRDRRTANVSP